MGVQEEIVHSLDKLGWILLWWVVEQTDPPIKYHCGNCCVQKLEISFVDHFHTIKTKYLAGMLMCSVVLCNNCSFIFVLFFCIAVTVAVVNVTLSSLLDATTGLCRPNCNQV